MSVQGQQGTGNACAKAILMGEHFVLYGSPAIAIPLPQLRLHVDLCQTDLGRMSSRSEEGPLTDPEVEKLISLAFSMMEVVPDSWDLYIRSNIPLGCGLGSSAALSVALLRALAQCKNVNLSPTRLNELAFELEKVSHGSPSGVDNAVVTMEGPVWFEMGAPPRSIVLPGMCLVLADTGIRGSTVQAVKGVRERAEKRQDWIAALARDAREETERLLVAMQDGHMDLAGDLLSGAHARLQELGVSTQMLDMFQRAAVEAGALGAKLTGAGQGGCILALVEQAKGAKVAEALTASGARQTWNVHTGGSP